MLNMAAVATPTQGKQAPLAELASVFKIGKKGYPL